MSGSIVGDFTRADSTAARGDVIAQPLTLVADPDTGALQVDQPIRYTLTDGHLAGTLKAGPYRFEFYFPEAYDFAPIVDTLADGQTIDLAQRILDGFESPDAPPVTVVRPPGLSAYQLAVQAGYVGSLQQWLASLRGPAGPAGNSRSYDFPVPQGTWTAAHDLNRLPSVTCVVDGHLWDAPTTVSTTQVVVTWPSPTAGTLVLI